MRGEKNQDCRGDGRPGAAGAKLLGGLLAAVAGAVLLLGDASRLAGAAAEVIELGAADLAAADDLDRVDRR
jgi:hypothetical protein